MVLFTEEAALEIEKAKEEKAEILSSLVVDALGGKRYSSLGVLGTLQVPWKERMLGESVRLVS